MLLSFLKLLRDRNFLPISIITLCGIFSKLRRCALFFWGFFWKNSWFEFQCLMIGALVKQKKNKLVLMFSWSFPFNEKKGHLMWSSCRTTWSFQYKTPSTALKQLHVLTFFSCYKVANTKYCWLFCFLISQWAAALWMQPNWNKCTPTCACTHSCTHRVLNTHLLMTHMYWTKYVKSEIIAANSTITMQNL